MLKIADDRGEEDFPPNPDEPKPRIYFDGITG
jgi:hypothetical protein